MINQQLDLNPKSTIAPAKGRLLVAKPFMADPYFRRTVVLLCEHNEEGSMGFVLNRSVDLKLHELIQGIPEINTTVSIGGPVGSGELFFIHRFGEKIEGSVQINDEFYSGGEFEQIKDILIIDPSEARNMRFFVGYSGWSEGQLNEEIEADSWFISNAQNSLIMEKNHAAVWRNTLRSMGSKFAPLANFPEDPSLN